MQFGVCLPHRWKYASARLIADVAQEAESLRFDSVWVTDHVIVPVHHVERGHIFYEALMTLAFVSSITRTVAMGTTVLATPTHATGSSWAGWAAACARGGAGGGLGGGGQGERDGRRR